MKMMKIASTALVMLLLPSFLLAGSAVFGFGPQRSAFYSYAYSTAALGRGGVETAVFDTIGVNYHNYAVWSHYGRTILSMDMTFENMTVKQQGKSYDTGDTEFTGGFLSFPIIKRRISMGIGLKPMIVNDQRFDRTFSKNDISGREQITTTGTISETTFAFAWNMRNRLAFAFVLTFSCVYS